MATVALNCPDDVEVRRRARDLMAMHSDEWIRALYERRRDDSLIKWKDSIKEVVGIERPSERGLDV